MHRLFLLSYLLKIPFHPHVTLINSVSVSALTHCDGCFFMVHIILSYLQPVSEILYVFSLFATLSNVNMQLSKETFSPLNSPVQLQAVLLPVSQLPVHPLLPMSHLQYFYQDRLMCCHCNFLSCLYMFSYLLHEDLRSHNLFHLLRLHRLSSFRLQTQLLQSLFHSCYCFRCQCHFAVSICCCYCVFIVRRNFHFCAIF